MAGVFCLAALVSYIDRLILSVLVDPIRHELAFSDSQISVLQGAAFAIVYVVVGLPLGRLADRRRRLNILIGGATLWCMGVIVCGVAPNFWALFAGRLLVGVGEASLFPPAVSMLADAVPPERRGAAMGLLMMGAFLGGPASIAVGGATLQFAQAGGFSRVPVVKDLSAWRQVLVVIGAVGLIVPALFLTLREPPRRVGAAKLSPLRGVAAVFTANRSVLGPLYLGVALLSLGDYALLSWVPSLTSRKFHLAPASLGVLIGTITTLAGACGSLSGGFLSDWRWRRGGLAARMTLTAAAAAIGVVGAVLVSGPSATFALSGLGLWTFASACGFTSGFAALQDVIPNDMRGIGTSLMAFCNTLLGLGLGPTLVALMTERVFGDPQAVGYSMTVIVCPAAVVACAMFVVVRSAARRPALGHGSLQVESLP
jgi:MFS family permease